MIWAQVFTVASPPHNVGDIVGNEFYYIPESFRWVHQHGSGQVLNDLSTIIFTEKYHFPYHITPRIVKGKITDAYGNGGLVGKDFGTNLAGNAKWAPGNVGYGITGSGIDNNTVIPYANLPKITEGPGNNVMWVCFGPNGQMPSQDGHHNWVKWLHDVDKATLDQNGIPYNWLAQVKDQGTDWGLGHECCHAKYEGSWNHKSRSEFEDKNVFPQDVFPVGNPFGAQMVYISNKSQEIREKDYQMKVLYEYGNCQYNFSRSGAPTRVLPNVVPVGPSPGIPAPL